MRNLTLLLFIIFILTCKKQKDSIQLKFLDEYILPDSLFIDNTLIGGLSGIDYQNDIYHIVCDDAKNPRFYKAKIQIIGTQIDTVFFEKTITVKDTTHYYDLESIIFEQDKLLLTSEGLIRQGKDPSFFSVSLKGEILDNFQLPKYYKATSKEKPRNNGVFEGLTRSFDQNGYWIITELPLESDGIIPTHEKVNSPVRMTYFDKESGLPKKQVVYQLNKIAKAPAGSFAVNGVTDLLAYALDKFLIIERSFSSGHGNNGNDIKIYDIDISKASNTLDLLSLRNAKYTPVAKKLLFDFESVRAKLTNNMIDNVEGISFGPELPDGNQSLILIVDNDFNKQGNRMNQFILMQIKE